MILQLNLDESFCRPKNTSITSTVVEVVCDLLVSALLL